MNALLSRIGRCNALDRRHCDIDFVNVDERFKEETIDPARHKALRGLDE